MFRASHTSFAWTTTHLKSKTWTHERVVFPVQRTLPKEKSNESHSRIRNKILFLWRYKRTSLDTGMRVKPSASQEDLKKISIRSVFLATHDAIVISGADAFLASKKMTTQETEQDISICHQRETRTWARSSSKVTFPLILTLTGRWSSRTDCNFLSFHSQTLLETSSSWRLKELLLDVRVSCKKCKWRSQGRDRILFGTDDVDLKWRRAKTIL